SRSPTRRTGTVCRARLGTTLQPAHQAETVTVRQVAVLRDGADLVRELAGPRRAELEPIAADAVALRDRLESGDQHFAVADPAHARARPVRLEEAARRHVPRALARQHAAQHELEAHVLRT